MHNTVADNDGNGGKVKNMISFVRGGEYGWSGGLGKQGNYRESKNYDKPRPYYLFFSSGVLNTSHVQYYKGYGFSLRCVVR